MITRALKWLSSLITNVALFEKSRGEITRMLLPVRLFRFCLPGIVAGSIRGASITRALSKADEWPLSKGKRPGITEAPICNKDDSPRAGSQAINRREITRIDKYAVYGAFGISIFTISNIFLIACCRRITAFYINTCGRVGEEKQFRNENI